MGRLVALGLFERSEDQTLVPTKHSARLRSSGRCDCFARELRDYCEYLAGIAKAGLYREIGGNSSPMSISRMSLASDRRSSCSPATRRGGLP
jgi:hypothetical protein